MAASATPLVRKIGITSLLRLMILVLLAVGQSASSAPVAARTRQGLPVLPKNAAGYTKIYELDGGFNAWKAAVHDLLNK